MVVSPLLIFFFMALAGGSLTFEELKKQAQDIGLEGKERTKFLTEGWRKIQDAAAEKERIAAEERKLAAEAGRCKKEKGWNSWTLKKKGC